MANLIAGNHLDAHAHLPRARDGCFGLLARRIEQRQHAHKLPLAFLICPGHAQRTEAASRKFIDGFLDGGLYLTGVGRHLQNYLRRSLGHIELFSVRAFDGGFGALMHRVERLEMDHLIALQGLIVLQAADHGQVDGVLVFRTRSQRGAEDDLVGRDTVDAERIAQRQLVLGQSAGLVRAQHVHARQFLDGRQPGHNRFFFRQQARADRHGHRQHRGHRHGNRGHGQHQGELQRGEDRVAAEERDGNNHRHQSHRENDQVIANLQHGTLEMADGVRLLHQLRRLAEVGVRAGGVHHRVDFALADNRPRKHRLARFALGGQRLARQCGLIHFHRVARQQARIRRHDVAQAQADDVARHQLTRRRGRSTSHHVSPWP